MATSFNTKHSYTRGLSALSETIHVYLFSGIPSSSDTSAYLSGSEAVGKAFQANAFQNNTFQTISKSLAVTSTYAYLMLRTPVDTNANIPAYMLGGITSSTTAYMLGMPQPIDVGPEATNRTAYGTGGYTHLDLTTPANVRGTIDTVTIFVNSQMSGVKVGIFYFVSGTTYKCRSATTLGTVPVGLNTYDGLSLGVYPGDFIGIYWSNGNLERDDTGGSNRYYTGDAVNVDAQTNFSGSGTRILSIHGSGYAGYYDEQSNTPIYLYGNLLGRGSTPIYTCGFGTEARSNATGYLYGQTSENSLVLGYTIGKDSAVTAVTSYIFGNILTHDLLHAYLDSASTYRTSIPIYLTTNTSSVSTQSVFVAGLTQTVNSLINAYISGIIKTQAHCYLSGQMTTTDYITLKTSDNGITKSKKFKVLTESYEELIRTKNENINKTIGGGIDHSIGENSTTWRMVIRVKANELNPDYGNLSDLEYFYSLNNPNASPNNDIIFTDHHQYEYIVHVIGQFKKNILTTAIEGQQALYFCSLEVLKV